MTKGENIMNVNKQEIINIAAKTDRITKSQCFEALQKLMNADDEYMQELYLARLYAYFMPKPPKKAKSRHEWVAKACAKKDDIRPYSYLHHLYSDGNRLFATNGHILFVADNYTLEPGYYNIQLEKITNIEQKYPNIDRVIPTEFTYEKTINIDDLEVYTINVNKKEKYYVHIDNDKENPAIDLEYLRLALNGQKTFNAYWNNKNKPIKITTSGLPDCFAIIMPMRV